MKKTLYIIIGISFFTHCKERYEIPVNSPATGYLVVEGRINIGSATSFQLSRTVKLSGNRNTKNNTVFPLTDRGKGLYGLDTLKLNATQKYRLHIKTAAGTDYLSDFVDLETTPPIDSINWVREPDGVHVYANAHDDLNNTKYYQWDYVETWEYHSAVPTSYKSENNAVQLRSPAEQIYQCWTSQASANIYTGSTAKLTKDVIYEDQLINIPIGSIKLSYLYSVIVKQYALSKEAYAFLESMKKNTEALGSVFDPQPSELKGNIHAVNNPDEPVIGFVTAGTVAIKRIFIYRSELPSWPYSFACNNPDTLVYNMPDSIKKYYGSGSYIPVEELYGPAGLVGWMSNETGCVDCRQLGGANVKPSFWP
jgi:hypothetical protein